MQRSNSAALRTTRTKCQALSCGNADMIVASAFVVGSVQPCSVMCGPGPPPAATESSTPPHESMSKSANRNEASDPSMVGCAHSCTVMSCDRRFFNKPERFHFLALHEEVEALRFIEE